MHNPSDFVLFLIGNIGHITAAAAIAALLFGVVIYRVLSKRKDK